MHDEKYVVFKREDIRLLLGGISFNSGLDDPILRAAHNAITDLLKTALDDAVVIRTQDVFATSGLRAYRDTMLTHRNLLFALYEDGGGYKLPAIDRLLTNLDAAIAYFTEVTIEAEDRFNRGDVKVPD